MAKVISEPINSLRQTLGRLPRGAKRAIMIGMDALAMPVCVTAALWMVSAEDLRFAAGFWLAGLLIVYTYPLFSYLGLYRSIVRFMGLDLVVAAFKGVSLVAVVATLVLLTLTELHVAVRSGVGFWVFGIVWVAGSRFAARLFFRAEKTLGDRVIIYGAGSGGARLANMLTGGQQFVPMAYVDDDPAQIATVINGLEVYSPAQQLLLTCVEGYSPTVELEDLVWRERKPRFPPPRKRAVQGHGSKGLPFVECG